VLDALYNVDDTTECRILQALGQREEELDVCLLLKNVLRRCLLYILIKKMQQLFSFPLQHQAIKVFDTLISTRKLRRREERIRYGFGKLLHLDLDAATARPFSWL
jgi:hypothetical protein